ncbi:NUDIX hydrolase [Herbidospora sp. NEAU-GS84]|uniref:NUDIX hydrolase n=1 Tax=Herbidospora solisilvae TaxID=2696284 RepID=A0A7C9N7P9_9ACTN|nr:Pycsar system effector family protein [Herbidospora solisilvae]NAS27474.1 NUDIX hydrolase [Herbidospora solisilvae]
MHQTIPADPSVIVEASGSPCDHRSVGVIIRDDFERFLVFDRGRAGVACVAGHVDEHGDGAWAARIQVGDQVDLTVTELSLVAMGWRPDRCDRTPGPDNPAYDPNQVGHQWEIYQARTSSDLAVGSGEVRNVRWLTAAELAGHAIRTYRYAVGDILQHEFEALPGLEPVWALWLARLGVIYLDPEELEAIEDLMAEGRPRLPARWWSARERLADLDGHTTVELAGEVEAVRADLARVDHKAALMLTFAGGTFSVLAALAVLAQQLAAPARVALAVAVVALVAATTVTLRTIRPVLAAPAAGTFGRVITGFMDHATAATPEELLERLGRDPEDRQVREIWCLSQIAKAKYRRLALALNLTLAGLAAVIVAVVLAVLQIGA